MYINLDNFPTLTSLKKVYRNYWATKCAAQITEKQNMNYTTGTTTSNSTFAITNYDTNSFVSPYVKDLTCYEQQAACCEKIPEKGTNMDKYETYGPLASESEKQRAHILRRLDTVAYDKTQGLKKAFRVAQDPPKTLKDLISRIKKDEFTYKKEDLEREFKWKDEVYYAIEWRTEPADMVGYDAALKVMEDAKRSAADEIIVSDPKEGLEVLRKFEAQKFS